MKMIFPRQVRDIFREKSLYLNALCHGMLRKFTGSWSNAATLFVD